MQPGGQSLVDRFLAAKNTIAGQMVAKVVCKATTEELIGPKRKHLDCLLQATHEMNVSIPEIADLLIERTQNSSWVVSFKALITIHHLMSFGNERFEAYMASHNHHLQSMMYIDRSGTIGGDMPTYIRRYSNYLNEKREGYKSMGYDFCKVKRGKEDGFLRTMAIDKLLKSLPSLCKQLDAILQFTVSPHELTNGIISSCFFLLVKDLVYLYAAFNDGMINLLEKYFEMNKKQCRESLDIYKKFIERTDRVSQYLKIAETSGLERTEVPDLSRAPSSLLEALENHLAHIEGKKISTLSLASKQQTEQDVKNFSQEIVLTGSDDPQKILEEEAKALEQFNKKRETTSPPHPTKTDADFFSSSKPASNGHGQLLTDDLFSLDTPVPQTSTNAFPVSQNLFEPSAPRQDSFLDILQPISTSRNNSAVPLVASNSVVSKPLQSGDLNSSLTQLIDNLDMKDHSKISKDHQWNPNEVKNQQRIGMNTTTMNAPGTTWTRPPGMSAPLSGVSTLNYPGNMWQQPPPSLSFPSTNNPFTTSNGSSQMTYGSINGNHNPFAASSMFGNSMINQAQVNDPFGSL